MDIEEIISLVSEAAKGKDYFEKGAVGSNGFGFVFKDLDSDIPYVTFKGSSKVFGAGSHRNVTKNFRKLVKLGELKNFNDLHDIDPNYDLLLAGSVKKLLPTIKFGGYEELFDVWMFVKTPEGKMFPATFYYAQSGLSIGGWGRKDSRTGRYFDSYTGENVFPEDFEDLINFSPFKFSDFEKNLFLDALEFALDKVPVSDFWGVFNHDLGNTLMGVSKGKPFTRELGDFEIDLEADKQIEPLLGKIYESAAGEPFTAYLIHGRKIYVIDFGFNSKFVSLYDLWFGDAKKTINRIESFQKEFF